MSNKPTVLVTGASGFLGGRLVEALYLSGFAKARAGVRAWSRAARVARFPVDIAVCDMMDPQQVDGATEGASIVVHCAYGDNREAIVQGTQNMLQAALNRGVQRFVFLSTAEVYGNEAAGPIDESAPYRFTGSVYGDAKIEAEQICWRFQERGLPITIFRPSIIYGPFGASWTIHLAQCLLSGNWRIFEAYGEGICNLVYVDDLVSAIFRAIVRNEAVGEALNINGPDTLTWNEYFERFNTALGLPRLPVVGPISARSKAAIAGGVAAMVGILRNQFEDRLMDIYQRGGTASRLMKRVKTVLKTTPRSARLNDLFRRRAVYVDDKARRILGYEPQFDLDAGLPMCVQWLGHHGYLQKRREPPTALACNGQIVLHDDATRDELSERATVRG